MSQPKNKPAPKTTTKAKSEEMGHAWYGLYEVVFKNSLSYNESLLRGMKIVHMEAAGGYESTMRDYPVPSQEIVRLRIAMARLAECGSAPQILAATVAMEFLATGELPGKELMQPFLKPEASGDLLEFLKAIFAWETASRP